MILMFFREIFRILKIFKISPPLRRDFYPSKMIIGVLINRSPPKLAVRLDPQSNPLLPPTPYI